MRFGRKREEPAQVEAPEVQEVAPPVGPFDVTEIDPEAGTHIDLGSLLIAPMADADLRVQVDEKSGEIMSVMVVGQSGALEARAFAAPKAPGMWADTRKQIAAEIARLGGTVDEREGPFGKELFVQQPVTMEDGQQGVQPSRVIGHEGPRWFLRVTLLGQPAVEPDAAGPWEDEIRKIAVRRGAEAKPPGEALPLVLPADAQRLG